MIAGLLVFLLWPSSAYGHKTFLASDQTVWDAGANVTVSLTSALEFPYIESGPSRDRIAFALVRVGQDVIEDIAYAETPTALQIMFVPQAVGFATVSLSTHPNSGEIAPEDVSEYFEEIGAGMDVRAAFDALPGDPAMMRSYTKHAKIFLCVETCELGATFAAEPVGQALEFVASPQSDRTFRLLWQGESLPMHDVDIYSAGGEHERVRTNSDGLLEVNADWSGAILISAVWITLPDEQGGNYHSDQATLSVILR
ncbi:DUF4198 domain-containing protein [Hyphobacterium sp.]|uniref:DUF4198 domain-containing protein n=1 Tax=Hyphobacterium sp. TaxID=2004662 RepID=UPI003BAAA296